jgi:hypothetical protein
MMAVREASLCSFVIQINSRHGSQIYAKLFAVCFVPFSACCCGCLMMISRADYVAGSSFAFCF